MRPEAYTVSYDRENFRAPIPAGFERGEVLGQREGEIRNNILRYLGEYRLGVKFDEFFYREESDSLTGGKHLSSSVSGPIREVFRRAIRSREERGQSARREIAECLGFQKLEQELLNTSDSKLFIWVSPPGAREDGYGLYSFTFIGQAVEDPDTRSKKIRVVPYRNILTLEEHRQSLAHFTDRTDHLKKDTDFLLNPIVFSPQDAIKTPEDILALIGEQERFNIDWSKRLKQRVGHLIDGYIGLVREGAPDWGLVRVRNAIENYTIAIRSEIIEGRVYQDKTLPTEYIFEEFGKDAPPPVSGSCGSTLMELHNDKNWEYHTGDCVVCHAKNIDVGPCSICKNCEKEFDAQETIGQAHEYG